MDKNAIDSKTAGQRNEKLVMELIKSSGSLSQVQICQKSGLGSSTISYIVGRLREKDLIVEKPGKSDKRGAKPIVIEINPDGLFIIGAEINPSYVIVGLFNFECELVDHIKISLDLDHSVENVVQLLEVNIKGILSKNNISSEKLTGIGVTLSGSTTKSGVVKLSSPLGWKDVPLKNLLNEKFDCAVDIYTTKVRLFAEMNQMSKPISNNIAYLNVANGVGLTVLLDGYLVYGSTNQCGELGHVVIDPQGPVCGCGQRGCLEAHISGPAIAKKINSDIANGVETILKDQISSSDIPEIVINKLSKAVDSCDEYALSVRDFIADKLSISAAMVINLYDPDIVILAGYVNDANIKYFTSAIQKRFTSNVYDESSRNIKIVPAKVKEHALIKGVASAVIQKEFEI